MSEIDKIICEQDAIVTPKTIDIFSGFAVTLKRIHIRLIAEGYIIADGEITKSEKMLQYEQIYNK